MDRHVRLQRGERRVEQVNRTDRRCMARRLNPRWKSVRWAGNTRTFRMPARSLFQICSLTRNLTHRLVLIAISCCWLSLAHGEDADWPVYLGGKERNLYSSLAQINRENVSQLEVAWTSRIGSYTWYCIQLWTSRSLMVVRQWSCYGSS